jgi:hypothetical protein
MTNSPWWRPYVQGILAAAVGALVVMLAWLLVSIYQVIADIRATQKSNETILEYNKDCTQPEGKCYKAAEARDAAQVGAFNAAVIAAAWCATQHPESRHELAVCVGKVLDGKKHQ